MCKLVKTADVKKLLGLGGFNALGFSEQCMNIRVVLALRSLEFLSSHHWD